MNGIVIEDRPVELTDNTYAESLQFLRNIRDKIGPSPWANEAHWVAGGLTNAYLRTNSNVFLY